MVLNYKYHSDSGVLQSYQDYTLAQGGGSNDVIVITSTDSSAGSFKYCLEFVCYNSRNVPKAQFVSPILDYGIEGVSFVVPTSVKQYAGHVDMQLIGLSSVDHSVVFKSINKGCKAFNVEASLNVLEGEIADTPNILTELLDEVDEYRKAREKFETFRDEIIAVRDEVETVRRELRGEISAFCDDLEFRLKNQVAGAIDNILQTEGGVFYRVSFRFNGEIVKSMCVKEGTMISPPECTLPDGCEVRDGWYDMSKDKLWDFLSDQVSEDVTLTLNYASVGIKAAANGRIKDFAGLTGDIYLPDYNNGAKITAIDTTVTNLSSGVSLHCGYNLITYAGALKNDDKVKQMYFPKDGMFRNYDEGVISDKEQMGRVALIFAPRTQTATYNVPSSCQQISAYAISNNTSIKKVTIPPTVTQLGMNCIYNTGITTLTIPASITKLDTTPVCNNKELTSVYLEGDISSLIGETTFLDMSAMPTLKRPTLYVKPEHYEAYVARGLSYDIQVMGKDYLDGLYA